jgi:hypothetical protein
MWNNQLKHSNEAGKERQKTGFRDEKAFRYPACFIEFIIENVNNLPLGVKDYTLTVRMRFALEAYKFTRLETFDFADAFDATIQNMAPTILSGLTFTTFQELTTEWDEDWDNVEQPYRDYRTRYRYVKPSTDIQKSGVSPVVNATITTSV